MFRTQLAAFTIAMSAVMLPVAAAAQDIGPEIGAAAPEFSAIRSDGATVTLADISGSEGAIIVFSRSLDWCPYCKKQALELRSVADSLAAAGWPVSLITYDPVETLSAYSAAQSINYTLLSDPGSAMIDAFGLRNEEVTPGSRFDGIPHPAIVFVDRDGQVAEMLREEGYRTRPESELLPEVAARLSAD